MDYYRIRSEKMKNIKRILSILLCAAMLFSVVMLSACDKNTNDNSDDETRSTDSGVKVEAVRLRNDLAEGEVIGSKDVELVEENEKYNLTAITEKEEVYLKHFYDSLFILNYFSSFYYCLNFLIIYL